MSEQTPASGEPEEDEDGPVRPRHQSAAERRSSETVMLDSGNLGDMVSQAKGEPAASAPSTSAPAPSAAAAPLEEEAQERKNVILIVGVAVVIVLAGIIGYLIYIAD